MEDVLVEFRFIIVCLFGFNNFCVINSIEGKLSIFILNLF